MLRKHGQVDHPVSGHQKHKKHAAHSKADGLLTTRTRLFIQVGTAVAVLLAAWYIADLFGFLRLPSSFVAGELPRWVIGNFREIRHTCEQSQLKKYGWTQHDGVNFGKQELYENLFKLTTSFVSSVNSSSDWQWSVRIRGEPLADFRSPVSLFFYVTSESSLTLANSETSPQGLSKFQIDGSNIELGAYRISMSDSSSETPNRPLAYRATTLGKFSEPLADLSKYHFSMFEAAPEHRWRVKDGVDRVISAQVSKLYPQAQAAFGSLEAFDPAVVATLPNTHKPNANIVVVQRVLQVPFELDIVCVARPSSSPPSEGVRGVALTRLLTSEAADFEERFMRTFSGIASGGYNASQKAFAMSTFSSLIGGLGYFSGTWLKHVADNQPAKVMSAQTLFSAVPSRSFFPRGFLWDEGFHQLLISRWDPLLTMRVLSSWLNLMTSSGWIPREQILGDEARSKVPGEFQAQHEEHANPPTLVVLTLRSLVDARSSMPEATRVQLNTFLSSALPRLRKNFQWYEQTQAGGLPNTFRWRGRTENHTLSSGLDDYPRAQMPSDKELHVDLQVWMIAFADVMQDIATLIGSYSHASTYANKARHYRAKLDDLFWNEEFGAYCDLADFEEKKHSLHKGYVSLFPLLFGLVPVDSPKLPKILSYVKDKHHLWSPFGLRSLSRSDAFFGTKEDYWRGPIWININYLALRALHKFYLSQGPQQSVAQDIYRSLRQNIINNIYKVYTERGYVWEQYHALTGEPKGCHPFTGWSSLVVLIMSEQY